MDIWIDDQDNPIQTETETEYRLQVRRQGRWHTLDEPTESLEKAQVRQIQLATSHRSVRIVQAVTTTVLIPTFFPMSQPD